MRYKQGDVVLVPFPFTDLSSKKTRPALVLSNSKYNGTDLILCGITSQSSGIQEIPLATHDMEAGGLPLISYVKYGKIVTVSTELIIGKLGTISKNKRSQILTAIQRILEVTL